MVAAVKNEHEVRVLDFMFAADPLGEVRREVAEFAPEIIALSVRNIDNQDSRHPESYFRGGEGTGAPAAGIRAAAIMVGGAGFSRGAREFMAYTGGRLRRGRGRGGGFREVFAAYPEKAWETVPG